MKNNSGYTSQVKETLTSISWDDDCFTEKLLRVAQLFRPFSEAITEFITEHGYAGDQTDIDAKVAFIRSVFSAAHMDAPREIREWFANQPIKRETAFQICFAFGLDGVGTDDFFQRIYARERSFNCHDIQEATYYFCLNNGLSWADALDIQSQVPFTGTEESDGEVVYTGSIITELNQLETKEEMISWLKENRSKFSSSNVTAYHNIRLLWQQTAGVNGLLIREREKLSSLLDDPVTGQQTRLRIGKDGLKPWDAYLAILQLDKKSVKELDTDRSIKPILEKLHDQVQDSFPDRQGIDRILRGEHVSYERVRKWLILLTFYTFWARLAISKGKYEADRRDTNRCFSAMNQFLVESGYPELYAGNPYDWIFLYASQCDAPLEIFRMIWQELLADTLDAHS